MENLLDIIEKFKKVFDEVKENQKNKAGVMELLEPYGRHLENNNSNIVAFLLNPKERHNHGIEYLKLFLEELGIDCAEEELENAQISREYSTNESRRIDILILLKNQAIIIESKIYAEEQDKQLDHYYEFVKNTFNKDKTHLLYLTRFPQETSTLSEENKTKLGDQFKNITWGGEILHWLRKLPTKLDEHLLESGIRQYIYSLEILTNQTKEDNEMKEQFMEFINQLKPQDIDCLNNLNELMNPLLWGRLHDIRSEFEFFNLGNKNWVGLWNNPEFNDIHIQIYYDNPQPLGDLTFSIFVENEKNILFGELNFKLKLDEYTTYSHKNFIGYTRKFTIQETQELHKEIKRVVDILKQLKDQ